MDYRVHTVYNCIFDRLENNNIQVVTKVYTPRMIAREVPAGLKKPGLLSIWLNKGWG